MTQQSRATPTIAVAMIVKDEAAVLRRCLASVRPIITHWVVVDTGSSDDTVAIIESELADLPGTLHRRPWRNFGHNRSELMELARGCADYLLLIDADMTLRIDGPLPQLEADSYLLRHAGSLDYAVPRLVRGDHPWRFEGATHEYLASDVEYCDAVLDGLEIEHHADGGSRGDKFERDRDLLEAELALHPDDGRTLFYLAQTYADLGEIERAVELYRRRAALGGWVEEVFCAQLRIGELLADRDWDAAVPELLHAWQVRPTRAEPLYHLARGYRSRHAYHLAHHFAAAGLAIPYPSEDRLFVQREPYEWGLRFEYAIAAHWVGDPRAAVEANRQLLADGVPAWVESWVRYNLAWSLRALGHEVDVPPHPAPEVGSLVADLGEPDLLAHLAPSVTVRPLDIDLGAHWPTSADGDGNAVRWPLFNPAIAGDGEGFRLIARTSNYRLDAGGCYEQIGGSLPIRTVNHLVDLDADLSVRAVHTLPELPEGPERYAAQVVGCEDARPIEVDGRWYAVATVRDRNAAQRCEMALVPLGCRPGDHHQEAPPDRSGGRGPGAVLSVLHAPCTRPGQHEKNWMPFAVDGRLHMLYSCSPTIVLEVTPETGEVREVSTVGKNGPCAHLRGGSPGVEVDGSWLFVAHEAAGYGPTRRYAHRVVRLVQCGDGSFEVDAVSPRFTFTGAHVEFCAGLAVQGTDALLSFGVGDAHAHLARVPLAELVALLEPA